MAVSSLNNFSVWNGSLSQQGMLMPKLKYRFRTTFTGFGLGGGELVELTKQVIDIKRPSINFNPITLDVYNSKVYLQGKPEWQETTINLRDDSSGIVTQLVGQQVQKQFDFLEQASAASGGDYKFSLMYEVLDGSNGAYLSAGGGVLETWEMYGCFISQVDYGDMNYGTNDPATIALTIRFDNAIQAGSNQGIGAKVIASIINTVTGGGV